MNDLLEWISRNNGAAFLLGVFIVVLVSLVLNFFVQTFRAITGHYPAASVTVRDKDDDEGEDGA